VGPCGIPLTAAPPELEVVVAGFVVVAAFVVVVAGADAAVDELELAGAAVEVCAAGAEVVDEVDELEPHAATPTATSTSRPGASRRIDLLAIKLMYCSSSCASEFSQLSLRTPKRPFLFPAR
jgi:hypothetical protein